jgi:hypothetical protein
VLWLEVAESKRNAHNDGFLKRLYSLKSARCNQNFCVEASNQNVRNDVFY